MSLLARILITAALLAALGWAAHLYNEHQREAGRAQVRAEWQAEREAANQLTRERRDGNLDRARLAEQRLAAKESFDVVTIKETLTEVRNETDNLAACKLDAGDVRVLNAAADRAAGGRAARPAPALTDAGLPAAAAPGQ